MSERSDVDQKNAANGGAIAVAEIKHDLSTKTIVVLAVFVLLLAAFAFELGRSRSKMDHLESEFQRDTQKVVTEVRNNTVATDLAKYNSEELRVQAEVNGRVMAMLRGGCRQ